MSRQVPDRGLESELLGRYTLVAGMDEVGRGALAGPVTVGVAVVSSATPDSFPLGLADSKQLSARARAELVDPVRGWVEDYAVAHAGSAEIDAVGIVGALRLAGRRALAELDGRGHLPGVVILDGVADWLSEPPQDLLTSLDQELVDDPGLARVPRVVTRVKADATCAVVSAASVLAKVERDGLMETMEDPGYAWASNKGYASPAHVRALERLGPSTQHRRSWHLPGVRPAER